jgi:hypothetical protein
MMPHVKAAGDGDALPNPYGVVETISRAWGEILTGIKNESQYGGVVDQRIINHRFKFSIKRKNREEGVSLDPRAMGMVNDIKIRKECDDGRKNTDAPGGLRISASI